MGEKSCSRGVKWVKKAVWGGKIDKKLSEGGKIGGKNCLRGVKLDKTVRGSQEKNMSEGGKKSCFVSEGGKENTHFCPRGSLRISLPLLFF